MNYQWTKIEKYLLKKNIVKPPKKDKRIGGELVPLDLRKLYFRKYMRWKVDRHYKKVKEWKEKVLKLVHEHNIMLSKLNAYKVLNDKPVLRSKPKIPDAPVDHIF